MNIPKGTPADARVIAELIGSFQSILTLDPRGAGEFTVNPSMNAVSTYESFGFVPAGAEVHAHRIAFMPMRVRLQNDV